MDNNTKWNLDLNIKPTMIKVLEENIKKILVTMYLGKFLKYDTKSTLNHKLFSKDTLKKTL